MPTCEALRTALPAFVSSRVASRPHVAELAAHLEQAGLAHTADVLHKYDARHFNLDSSAFADGAFVKYELDLASRVSTGTWLKGQVSE